MKYKEYSSDIWSRIQSTLDQVLKDDPNPIAAFDADGTLWDTDLGECFFHHQIDHKLVALPAHAYSVYEEMKKEEPTKAYLWLAQICQNQKLEQVHHWAKDALRGISPVPVFSEQKKLIDLLVSRGVTVYIITASVKWAVEPGAEMLGLQKQNVLGVETKIINDVISDQQKGMITYRQGKVDALLDLTKGKKPFFASGNTMGDFQLLQSATHLSLAVSAAASDDKLYKTEQELQGHAVTSGWLHHRFI